MRPLHWNSSDEHGLPYRWNQANVTWSGILEPGDPGYIDPNPPAQPSVTKPKRKTHMPKSDYIKNRDSEFSAQLSAFKLNIGAYATLVGVSAAQIAAQAADADYFAYTLACQEICNNCSQQWTSWKDLVRDGGTPPATGAPAETTFPAIVPAVALGIEVRFRALVKQIKAQPAYNVSIGQALGIEGEVHSGPDFAILKPLIKLEISGGFVIIRWGWQGYSAFLDMIEILVDRGDGKGFTTLAQDTTPDYTDTTPAPAAPAKWTYKAIFHVGDQRVGQWSDEASLTVGG